MLLIRINKFSKQIQDKLLFDEVDLLIHSTDRIGLVGKNGTGKTTLLNEIYNNPAFLVNKNIRIGYLKQNIDEEDTVLEFILDIKSPEDWFDLEKNRNREELNKLSEKLNFSTSLYDRRLNTLSGGEKTKAYILKVMLQNPDLLLLDEPTNHLDLRGIEYLKNWLTKEYSGAFILVSHNRDVLNSVTTKTIEIFNKKLYSYNGNYDYYKQKKLHDFRVQMDNYNKYLKLRKKAEQVIQEKKQMKAKAQSKLRKKREAGEIGGIGFHKMVDNLRKIDADIKSIRSRVEIYKENKPFEDTEKINLTDFEIEKSYKTVLTIKNLEYSPLFKNVNLEIFRGQKICIIGDNGCGKTTLFRIISSELNPTKGECILGTNVKIGYLKQNLDKKDISIWDYLKTECSLVNEQKLRDYLGKFLFKRNDIYKKLSVLSGGELTRLELLKLVLNRCNFLLLDEPTNNLDIESIETLESILSTYPGTLLFISHDIRFIKNLGAEVYELTKKGLLSRKISN